MEEDEITTISVSRSTRDKLAELKIHPNQSFDEVLIELLKRCGKWDTTTTKKQ